MRRGQKEHAVWRGYHQIVSIFIATLYQHHFSTVGCDKHTVNALQDNGHPDSNVHGANMGPTWVLSAPDGPHVGPMNLAIRACSGNHKMKGCYLCSWRDRLPNSFNSPWSSDDTLWHRSRSILFQVMVCCMTAPSHCLNWCWLIISEVLWHCPEGNFTGSAQDIYPCYEFENY